MSNDYFDFLQNTGQNKNTATEADNLSVNLTVRADADCQVVCDGDFLFVLQANRIVKEKAPFGQHILQFISLDNPDLCVEKIVDFSVVGKSYLVIVNEFKQLMASVPAKEEETKVKEEETSTVSEDAEPDDIGGGENAPSSFTSSATLSSGGIGNDVFDSMPGGSLLSGVYVERNSFVEEYCDRVGNLKKRWSRDERERFFSLIDTEIRPAADSGDSGAGLVLGHYYSLVGDMTSAVAKYRWAADLGNAVAQKVLGNYYYDDLRDYPESVILYRQSAEQGYAPAQHNLGNAYYYGKGVDKDFHEAVKWYRAAAEQGNAKAQYQLGKAYYYGNGVDCDIHEAAKWYRAAAEQGDSDAQYSLGYCYQSGVGFFWDHDYKEAVKWYRAAAEQGNAIAQCQLGYCYNNHIGVPLDEVEAVKWYRKSAEQGVAVAQSNLGECYENGWGVPRNLDEARKWYKLAAEQGYDRAIEHLKKF